jgi:hypothetical protein
LSDLIQSPSGKRETLHIYSFRHESLLIEFLNIEVRSLLLREDLGFEENPQLEDSAWLDYVGASELHSKI